MITKEEWQDWFAGPDTTWEELARWLKTVPCDCGEDHCKGWQAVYNGGTPT